MPKAAVADIRSAILKLVPRDGTSVGNISLREQVAERLGAKVAEDDYFAARDELVAKGKLAKGQGREAGLPLGLDGGSQFRWSVFRPPAVRISAPVRAVLSTRLLSRSPEP